MINFEEVTSDIFSSVSLTHDDWVQVLGFDPLVDFPSPRQLYQMLITFKDMDNISGEVLDRFYEILDQPGYQVSSSEKAKTIGTRLGHYMLEPLRESLNNKLAYLPTEWQELFLVRAIQSAETARRGM